MNEQDAGEERQLLPGNTYFTLDTASFISVLILSVFLVRIFSRVLESNRSQTVTAAPDPSIARSAGGRSTRSLPSAQPLGEYQTRSEHFQAVRLRGSDLLGVSFMQVRQPQTESGQTKSNRFTSGRSANSQTANYRPEIGQAQPNSSSQHQDVNLSEGSHATASYLFSRNKVTRKDHDYRPEDPETENDLTSRQMYSPSQDKHEESVSLHENVFPLKGDNVKNGGKPRMNSLLSTRGPVQHPRSLEPTRGRSRISLDRRKRRFKRKVSWSPRDQMDREPATEDTVDRQGLLAPFLQETIATEPQGIAGVPYDSIYLAIGIAATAIFILDTLYKTYRIYTSSSARSIDWFDNTVIEDTGLQALSTFREMSLSDYI